MKKMDTNQDDEDSYHNPHHSSFYNAKNNVSFNRQMMPRMSVRSISVMPNIIGAQAVGDHNDFCTYALTVLTWFIVVAFFPISIIFILRVIQEYERGLLAF